MKSLNDKEMIETIAEDNELSRRNRDLNLLRAISLVLQSSIDPAEVQEAILRGLVYDMAYPQATIALYDENLRALTSWITLAQIPEQITSEGANEDDRPVANIKPPVRLAHTDVVLLEKDYGPLARALNERRIVEVMTGEAPLIAPFMKEKLITGQHYIILPMVLRGHLIGVILIDHLPEERPLSTADHLSLEHLTTHAGVALGSVRLCIDRAQRTAVAEERNRIAAELHDNVSQALYGLAYGLDACVQLLPLKAEVGKILKKLQTTVTDTQQQIRTTIFDMRSCEITSDAFVADLHRHLRTVSPTETIALRIDLPGNFDRWHATIRRYLHQVAQEALVNVAKHANADQIIVRLGYEQGRVELRVADDGEGFDPLSVDDAQCFGLKNMMERIKSLGGTVEINSAWGEGTLIIVQVPHPYPLDRQAAIVSK